MEGFRIVVVCKIIPGGVCINIINGMRFSSLHKSIQRKQEFIEKMQH